MMMKILLMTAIAMGFIGCANPVSVSEDSAGLSRRGRLIETLQGLPTVGRVVPWSGSGQEGSGLQVDTLHYQLYTTVEDPLLLRQFPFFLETLYRHYISFLPEPERAPERLRIYLFGDRGQWSEFTREQTGHLADQFLAIPQGAYSYRDICVVYFISRRTTFSILAHEGFHQYASCVVPRPLPVWLNEGLATQCEAYRFGRGKIEIEPRLNGSRLWDLKQTIQNHRMISLEQLVSMDVGQILNSASSNDSGEDPDPRLTAYYSQIYALVRFLNEYQNGRFALSFQTLLGHYACPGPLPEDSLELAFHEFRPGSRVWNSHFGPLLFRSYIHPDIESLDGHYQLFCRQIAAEARFRDTPSTSVRDRGAGGNTGSIAVFCQNF